MNLTPERKAGESFDAYKRRRSSENEAVARHLGGRPVLLYRNRPKLGKAATKRMKRERQRARVRHEHKNRDAAGVARRPSLS